MKLWMIIPVLGSIMLLAAFYLRLVDPADVNRLPSALIDRPVPEFELPALRDDGNGLSTADLKAPGVKLVNIWASWCGPCRAEHPFIKELAKDAPVHGLNYKDKDADAQAFLNELGDPFTRIGADRTGRTGIEFGVYGVPETFVVDANGTIVYKHVGPILGRDMEKMREAIDNASK